METIAILLAVISTFGFAYFLIDWISASRHVKQMTPVEKMNMVAAESVNRSQKLTLRARGRKLLDKYGWDGDPAPLLLAAGALLVGITLVLTLLGLNVLLSTVLSLPAAFGIVTLVDRQLAARRKSAFDRQLIDVLDNLATELASGTGLTVALTNIPYMLSEPAASEFRAVSDRVNSGTPADIALLPTQEMYPSAGMKLLIGALRIDRERGASIESALRHAAESMRKREELISEMKAEIAQVKMEGWAVFGITVGIAGYMVLVQNAEVIFGTVAGLVTLAVCTVNILIGAFRMTRLTDGIKRGLL